MKKTMPEVPQEMKSAVNAYMMARAYAETMRERVDVIQRRLLADTAYFADPEMAERRRVDERVTDPKLTFLMKDDEFHDYLIDLKAELKKDGLTVKEYPGDPEYSYGCPALIAEDLQMTTERLVIDTGAAFMGEDGGEFHYKLLCAGMDKYHAFIDLVCKLVVNLPGFKNPLTGEAV